MYDSVVPAARNTKITMLEQKLQSYNPMILTMLRDRILAYPYEDWTHKGWIDLSMFDENVRITVQNYLCTLGYNADIFNTSIRFSLKNFNKNNSQRMRVIPPML